MTTTVRLLGSAAVRAGEHAAQGADVRGHKPWLLLALLLLSETPLGRDRLARLVFVDAADPGAALRWNLSQLRHLGLELDGDPVRLRIPDHVAVDLDLLLHGRAEDAAALPGLDEDLLSGLRLEAGSELAVWLEEERRRVHELTVDIRREAALSLLARGRTGAALAYARQVVAAAPLDENAAALLVRCLRAAGHASDARAAADSAAQRLREELGVEPSNTLWRAVTTPLGGPRLVTGTQAVAAQVEAGEAAVAAGAADAGVAVLQGALGAARALDDHALLARALVALGSALIHAVRGVDQEGLVLLHEAVPLTVEVGDVEVGVVAHREIGYVDFLRGRYDRAAHWFGAARTVADGTDTPGQGWIDVYEGAAADDVGSRGRAATRLRTALDHAAREDDRRLHAYGLAMLGRHHLLGGDLTAARDCLDESVEATRRLTWTAFHAYPESLLAEVALRDGLLGRSQDLAEHAYVLAEQVNDPCWLSMSLRQLGLVAVESGDLDRGLALLSDAPAQCRRLPDTYRWIELWALAALADVGLRHQVAQAPQWAAELDREAASHGMRPFLRGRQRAADVPGRRPSGRVDPAAPVKGSTAAGGADEAGRPAVLRPSASSS